MESWVPLLRPLALQQIRFHAGHNALDTRAKVWNLVMQQETIGKPLDNDDFTTKGSGISNGFVVIVVIEFSGFRADLCFF